jgi:hypothetical protein
MSGINGTLVPPELKQRKVSSGTAFSLADLPNPLQLEINDPSELKALHREFLLVPYAGTVSESGDSLRAFLASMTYLSPTHGACIASKKDMAFGKIVIKILTDQDFNVGRNEDVSTAQAQAFLTFMKEINLDGKTWKDLAQSFHEDWEESGDQFLEIAVSKSLGVDSFSIFRHKPANCKYIATKRGEQRFLAISPIWDDTFLRKNPPTILPLFPAFKEEGSISRTILHRRHGKNEWYGRPPAFSSWIYQYREFQDSTYLVKVSNNNFTGQIIIEAEDDNPQKTDEAAQLAGFANEADRIAKNFTAQAADPMTVWYCTRPFGAKEMFAYQVKPNTSENFYTKMDALSEKHIIRAHNWSKRLMEATEAGGLSTNVFMDVLKSKLPVIAQVQEDGVSLLNKALQAVVTLAEKKEFEGLGLSFISPYQEILEQVQGTGLTEPQKVEPQ